MVGFFILNSHNGIMIPVTVRLSPLNFFSSNFYIIWLFNSFGLLELRFLGQQGTLFIDEVSLQ